MSAMLDVKNIQVAYGKIVAVKDISVTVNQGEIVTLIGSNGAGKSTTLRTISGLINLNLVRLHLMVSESMAYQGMRLWQWAYVMPLRDAAFSLE